VVEPLTRDRKFEGLKLANAGTERKNSTKSQISNDKKHHVSIALLHSYTWLLRVFKKLTHKIEFLL
jgi:hypothetical protein